MSINTTIVSGHKVIINPDSIADVRTVIGSGSGDLGTLCQSKYINKWAKYKPVSVANLINTTGELDTQRQIGNTGEYYRPWRSDATWYKGNGTCGLQLIGNPAVWNSSPKDSNKTLGTREAEYISLIDWTNKSWKYVFRPGGTMTSPYRIIDFNCYDHNAVPFIKGIIPPEYDMYYAGDDDKITWELTFPSSAESALSLSMQDIKTISGNNSIDTYRLGLVFVNIGHEFEYDSPLLYCKFMTINTKRLNQTGGNKIEVTGQMTAALVDEGNVRAKQVYEIVPFLTDEVVGEARIWMIGDTGALFPSMIAVPNVSTSELTLAPNEFDGNIEGTFEMITTSEYYTFDGIFFSLINLSSTKTMTFSKSTFDSNFKFQVWRYNATTYEKVDEFSFGSEGASYYLDSAHQNAITTSITLGPRESKVIYVHLAASNNHFDQYTLEQYRVTGSVSYSWSKPGGSTGTSTSTLLANPPREPSAASVKLNWKPYIELASSQSGSFTVNIRMQNIGSSAQTFSWANAQYDVVSAPYTSEGVVDYSNALEQLDRPMSGTTPNIQPYAYTDIYNNGLTISPRDNNYGYYAIVTIHGADGFDMERATLAVDYHN